MADTNDLNPEIQVENVPSVEREVQVITEFNAPNDYTDPETLQKFYSGVPGGDTRSTFSCMGFNPALGKTRLSEMSGPRVDTNPGKKSSTVSRDVNIAGNMADPSFQNHSMKDSMSFFYQQQLLQTQTMFIEQQKMLNKLSASMDSIKKAGDKRKNSDSRQTATMMEESTEERSSDSEENESGECSGSEEEVLEDSKRQKLCESLSDRRKEKLKSVEKTFGQSSKFSPAVQQELAQTINKALGSSVDHKNETVKELLNKYERPENCEFLDVPKVEKSIWTSRQTGKELKESDKQMQRTQLYLTKGLMPLVSIMSKTFETDSEEAEEIFDLALDAFSLLAYSHRDLSTQRKRMLMPAISSKYKGLCGDDTSITANQLFGENLSEQIKKIDESGKISNKLSKWKNKTYYKSERKESDFSKSGGQNFRYGGKGHSGHKQNSFLSKKDPRAHQKSIKKGSPVRHQK